jgi:hypothetical protein
MELQQPPKTEQQTLTTKQRTPGIISHLIQAFKKRRLEAQTPVLSEKTLQDIGVTHAKILAGFIRP